MIERQHLAWPFFDDTHREFAPRFATWVAQQFTRFEAEEGGDGRAAREIFTLLGAAGWLSATVATDGRLDLRRICLMREILGYSSAMADVALSEPWLAVVPIVLYGSQEQRRKYVDTYAAGGCLPAFALSEPDAGSDVAAIATTAMRTADGYVLDGRKTWTSNSGLADAYVVFARTEGAAGARGIDAFIVDGDNPGVALEQRLRVLPPHTVGTLRFDGCRVPSSNLLGDLGLGFEIAMRVLELFRTSVAAATVG